MIVEVKVSEKVSWKGKKRWLKLEYLKLKLWSYFNYCTIKFKGMTLGLSEFGRMEDQITGEKSAQELRDQFIE